MTDEDLLVGGAVVQGSEIDVARRLVVAIDIGNYQRPRHAAHELSVEVVDVDVVKAVALAGQHDVAVGNLQLLERLLLDVFLHLVLDDHRADRRQRVAHIDLQVVLMAVHRQHADLRGVAGRQQAGNVAVLVERQLERTRLVALDVVAEDADLSVHLARHGVLVRVLAGIVAELAALGGQALEHLHRVLAHLALVETHPHQLLGVGGEGHRRVEGELLLVDPVGDAVDHLVALAVLRHLALSIVVEQLHEEDVVVAHEGDDIAVGAPDGRLLRTAIAEGLELVVLDGVNIIGSCERAAIDALRLRLYQDALAVRAHRVAINISHLRATGRSGVEEDTHLLARTERVSHDTLTVVRNLGIALAVAERFHSSDGLTTEGTADNLLQLQSLSCKSRQRRHEQQRADNHHSLHSLFVT